ncbi:phosphoglycerate kinase [Rickettsiales endosymbiont of Stachyamoeba lipophora]|uniref:phosphoglycerate kinase n=1 Tax=Rickettsiales endosymbiont of Stachyamoeba lipophora TaxID=2486578 RepID=UPI000F64C3FC|nr:phosphoglycerate kinase [Rickettsiales endosymbiont of Stachyamoeba lipophora]AZL15228.1 phosphoglycerate kinase [Rickettsiales endosymbiont of Stachyamoeba lipophora]
MNKITTHDFTKYNLSGKRVLLRLDLNLSISNTGEILDDTRLRRSLISINQLIKQKAKIIILSHLGRPKGKKNPKESLTPIFKRLKKFYPESIFIEDIDNTTELDTLKEGNIALLENLRFWQGEQDNDINFAMKLSSLADFFINDAFACCHRNHSSITKLPMLLPSAPGLLMIEEVTHLHQILENNLKPSIAILGGNKVSTKIDLLKSLVTKMDYLFIGGAMANNFLSSIGFQIGNSIKEESIKETCTEIIALARNHHCQIMLPVDAVVTPELKSDAIAQVVSIDKINDQDIIADIGPQTLANIDLILSQAKLVIWNGPVGAYEFSSFSLGSITISQMITHYTNKGTLTSIAGGGDVISAINMGGNKHNFSYLSTAGGAFLEWLEGKSLVGITALSQENIDESCRMEL